MLTKTRHRQDRAARLRRRFQATLAAHGAAFTVDISPGGVCLERMHVLLAGAPVEGTLQLKDARVPFAGRVVWAKSGDPHLGLRGKMGVAFTRVGPEFSQLFS